MNTQVLQLCALTIFGIIILYAYLLFLFGSKKQKNTETPLEEVISRASQLYKTGMHLELQRYVKRELIKHYKSVDLRSILVNSYFKTRNYRLAAAHLDAILQIDNTNYSAKGMLADCLRLDGQFRKAIVAYEELLIEQPSDIAAIKSLMELYIQTNNRQLALKYLKLYSESDHSPEEMYKVYSQIARLHIEAAEYAEAARAYDKLQESNLEDVDLMFVRANLYLKMQDWQTCLDIYTKILNIQPDDMGVYEKIGQMKFNLGQWDEALELYKDIVENEDVTSQNYIHHKNRIAEIYVNQGKSETAIEILTGLIKKYPTEDLLAFTLAQAYISLGDFEKAVGLYTNLMENLPQDQVSIIRKHISDLVGAWGTDLFHQGNYNEAFDKFFLALKYDENNSDIYYKLGTSNFRIKSYNDAIAHFKRAIAISPQESTYYLALGYTFDEFGDLKNAKTAFTDAININPLNVKAYNALAITLAKEYNLETALEQFAKVLEFTPNDPDANYNCALTYEMFGEKDMAIKYYRKALAAQPEHIEARHNLSLLLGYDISSEGKEGIVQ